MYVILDTTNSDSSLKQTEVIELSGLSRWKMTYNNCIGSKIFFLSINSDLKDLIDQKCLASELTNWINEIWVRTWRESFTVFDLEHISKKWTFHLKLWYMHYETINIFNFLVTKHLLVKFHNADGIAASVIAWCNSPLHFNTLFLLSVLHVL